MPEGTRKKGPKKGIRLSPQDRVRMARLYEEVDGRLQEMAVIFARTVGRRPKPLRAVTLRLPPSRTRVGTATRATATAAETGGPGELGMTLFDGGYYDWYKGV